MPGYGVPDDAAGVLPWSWAEERLLRSSNYWVVTVSAEGRPHALPVWGVWLPEAQTFGFSSAPDARKVRNLRDNPRVVVTGEDTVEVVSVEGVATELHGEDREPVIVAFAEKYEADPDKRRELADFLRRNLVVCVTPERAFGIIERAEEFSTRATKWVWKG